MWYVYILKSVKDDGYYIGSTGNIEQRLKKHNAGGTISTKNRRPFELVYKEWYYTKSEALLRERSIKNYKGGNAFRELINRVGTQVVNEGRL